MTVTDTIEKICREFTSLKIEEIREIKIAAKSLQAIANLFDADAFIDCRERGCDSGCRGEADGQRLVI